MTYKLVIGNKNYSSWSMRAWLLLRWLNLPFEEVQIALDRPGAREQVRRLGGEAGLVPVLIDGELAVWDSLAVFERLAERWPGVWPDDAADRARARSLCAEVHAGLSALRAAMPVNVRARNRRPGLDPEVEADLERVRRIWSTAGRRGSPWLFGAFCAADVMFAPVALRFQTYGVQLDGRAEAYRQALLAHPLVQEWQALGAGEPAVIERFELPERTYG